MVIPRAVADSKAYTGASPAAKALLYELVRQHNGANNGRLHLAKAWLRDRGWKSKGVVDKAIDELMARGLVVQTRQGGRVIGQINIDYPPPGMGPNWYALTWKRISDYRGLELQHFHPGAWRLADPPPRLVSLRGAVARNSAPPMA